MRRRSAEENLRWRRTAERLMRAEVRVVDEAELDCRGEVFRCGWPQQAQAERVLQRPPEAFDQRESLSIGEGTDGRVLLKCHAGCEAKAVVAALDMSLADLFENSTGQTRAEVHSIYRYQDQDGHDLFQVVRYRPKDFRVGRRSISGGFEWGLGGVAPVLYRLPDVLEAVKASERIFIVEGEKDVDSLFAVGLKATTNFGGAGKWRPSYSESLRNARVAIIPDNDETGRTHAQTVAAALTGVASEVKVRNLSPAQRRQPENLGSRQPLPRSPDAEWPERPAPRSVPDPLEQVNGVRRE
jgi:5S rRNA maturation endonuclease (ribonuclease M5)